MKLSEIIIGKGEYGIPASAVEYLAGMPIYLRITDITDDGFFRPDPVVSFDYSNYKDYEKFKLEYGDIVFARTGNSTGRNYLYSEKDGALYYAGFLIKYKLNPLKVVPEFIGLYCKSDNYRTWIENVSKDGSTRRKMNAQDYLKMSIPDISLSQQRNIVNKIKPLEEKIILNREIIANLEEYSQLLFHKWFVDFNFPNENGEPYKDSGGEMVEVDGKKIPKSWQDIPLIDAAFFINGLAMQKFPPKNELDMLPVIKIKEINNNGYGKETEYVTKTIDKDLVVNDGDILFPWSGSLSVNIWTGGVGGLNQHIFKVKSDKFDKWFIYLWLKNHMRFFEKIAYGKKTTMGHINRKHLGYVNVLVPEKHTLKVMNDLMNPIFNKIVSLNIENRKLTEYRDLLINKLVK